MNILNSVEETALITLRSRVIEAGKKDALITDHMGAEILKKISGLIPADIRKRILESNLPSSASIHIALRARKYDKYTRLFLQKYPGGLIVNLGCGFDTRFWRLGIHQDQYIELDLPEVITVKKNILGKDAVYRMISCSVTDPDWIKQITSIQKEKILFLAEGLFMYLHKEDVKQVFKQLDAVFTSSEIVFEVVNEMYTKGMWKKMVENKMKRRLNCSAGSSYNFGVKDARDIESFGKYLRVIEEWSYVEDEDIKPWILKLFRKSKMLTRSQWTIRAGIG